MEQEQDENVLAVDSCTNKICVAAKTKDSSICIYNNSSARQSQKMLPLIDFATKQLGLCAEDLKYTATTVGPGSFTGLRLSLASLKALTLSYNIPCYGICSLDLYRWAAKEYTSNVISVMDAHQGNFYAKIYENDTPLLPCDAFSSQDDIFDCDVEALAKKIDFSKKLIICGPDSSSFLQKLQETKTFAEQTKDAKKMDALCIESIDVASMLFQISKKMRQEGMPPMKDFYGPIYSRKAVRSLLD